MKTKDFWTKFYNEKINFLALYIDYQELKARDRTCAEDVQFGAASTVISKHMET